MAQQASGATTSMLNRTGCPGIGVAGSIRIRALPVPEVLDQLLTGGSRIGSDGTFGSDSPGRGVEGVLP